MPIAAQYSSHQIPPWLEAMARSIAEQSRKIAGEQYHPYNNERIAPFSKEQMEAQNLSRRTGEYDPYFARSRQMLERSGEAFPDAYARYRNPYDDAVVNRIGVLGARNFQENILPALSSTFSGLGHFGSSQHQRLAQRAARDVQENVLAQQRAALHQGFGESARIHEADRLRALQAGEGMRDLGRYGQAARFADIAALEHSGQQQQGHQQQHLDTAYNDFLRQRGFPRAQLAEHAATVQGLPHSELTYGRNQFPNQYQYPQSGPFAGGRPNMLSNIGSLAGQLYGISRMGRKEGGSIKKNPDLGQTSLNTSSFIRQPKVGGKTVIPKRVI
jgi:hypothetical protein